MLALAQLILSNSSWQKKVVVQIEYPPYSPDIDPPDFFLFPLLKPALRGKGFAMFLTSNEKKMTKLLNSISKEDFLQGFHDMYSISLECIVTGGDYFERQ
ncbi:hypothetical protein TNCV_4217281 [Trichonephila clavipes]|nr:hypothetical protein TNCV_4217281 [Trichonephila clavipes]